MSASRRTHLTNDHERSPFISERRRKLFPSNSNHVDNRDTDLEGMSFIDHNDVTIRSNTPVSSPSFTENVSLICLNMTTPHDSSTKAQLDTEQRVLLEQSKKARREETDAKTSKVRTALFPPEKFYSGSSNEDILKIRENAKARVQQNSFRSPTTKTSHKSTSRRFKGEINKGVRHSIKKPKPRKVKTRMSSLPDASVLNEYIQDLVELRAKEGNSVKLINPPKDFDENKENIPKQAAISVDFQEEEADEFFFDSTSIITNLSPTCGSSGPITLQAHNSVTLSENSIQLHLPSAADTILSPISHMCDVTSGLAINSPSSKPGNAARNLSFNDCRSVLDTMQQSDGQKLFPIFCKDRERGEKRTRNSNDIVKRSIKRFKGLHSDQMLLDFGQKNVGVTICHECGLAYSKGDPNEELEHEKYHNSANILRFGGWKHERVIADYHSEGRVIRIRPSDPKPWLNKLNDIMDVVKRDLGCYEMSVESTYEAFLYIKNRTVAGCVLATVPKEGGHKMLTCPLNNVAMCSEETYPIKCGISHMWVASSYRKQGIASRLLDVVKSSFLPGVILSNHDVALTTPTEEGAIFAQKYFKTSNYLIYYS